MNAGRRLIASTGALSARELHKASQTDEARVREISGVGCLVYLVCLGEGLDPCLNVFKMLQALSKAHRNVLGASGIMLCSFSGCWHVMKQSKPSRHVGRAPANSGRCDQEPNMHC